jgi:hypothetical protein
LREGVLVVPLGVRLGREGLGNPNLESLGARSGSSCSLRQEEGEGGWFYDGSEHDWLLRLIKLRGGRDYVENVLMSRCGKGPGGNNRR